jgi:hypothetical protein
MAVLECIECETFTLRTCYYSRHYHWYFESILPLRLILMHYHNSITHAQTESRFKTANISLYTRGSYCTCTCIWFACAAVRETEKEQTAVWLLPPASLSIMSLNTRETIGQWRAEQVCTYTREFQARCIVPVSSAQPLLDCIYLHFTRTPTACSYFSWVGLNLYIFLLRLHVCWPTGEVISMFVNVTAIKTWIGQIATVCWFEIRPIIHLGNTFLLARDGLASGFYILLTALANASTSKYQITHVPYRFFSSALD